MAASSADDIPTQLAALLGREAVQIRKTDESPPRVAGADARVARVRRPAVRAVDRVRLRDEALRLDPGAAEGEVRRAEGAEGLGRALEPRFMATVDQAEPALPGCHAVEVDEDEEVGAEDLAVAPHGVARHRRAADAGAALVLAVAVTAPVQRGPRRSAR